MLCGVALLPASSKRSAATGSTAVKIGLRTVPCTWPPYAVFAWTLAPASTRPDAPPKGFSRKSYPALSQP